MEIRGLARALFPTYCPGCGHPAASLCLSCEGRIVRVRAQGCYYCGRLAPGGRTCPACRRKSALSGVVIAAHYDSPLKETIWQLKYDGRRGLAAVLAPLLSEVVSESRARVVTAVPLHRQREWWRGYNQSELLAKRLPALPYRALLRRTVRGRPQTLLGRRERLRNLEDAFRALGPVPSRVLLIDDVATTGATLEAAARALREGGAREVWAAVIARHK